MRKNIHPVLYKTKVFIGSEETYIWSTCKEMISVLSPDKLWVKGNRSTVIREHSQALNAYNDF
jgi:hypothetical protein